MPKTIDRYMLETIELFHYAQKFKDTLFVIMLDEGVELKSLLYDIRLLEAASIRSIIVGQHSPDLHRQVQSLKKRGYQTGYHRLKELRISRKVAKSITEQFLNNQVNAVIGLSADSSQQKLSCFRASVNLAKYCKATKVFVLSKVPGVVVDGRLISHLSSQDGQKYCNSKSLNISRDFFETLLLESKNDKFEIALLEGVSGSLFEEVFTHKGRGTLFTDEYPNKIRRAKLKDIREIMSLLSPHVRSGRLTHIDEDLVAEHVHSFYVYTVNHAVIACAQLIDYGYTVELGKFSTMPRFQGKGRARELVLHMSEVARKQGKEEVFAVSISKMMWNFFQSMGFRFIDRKKLPDDWKEDYDFSRLSRALHLKL